MDGRGTRSGGKRTGRSIMQGCESTGREGSCPGCGGIILWNGYLGRYVCFGCGKEWVRDEVKVEEVRLGDG